MAQGLRARSLMRPDIPSLGKNTLEIANGGALIVHTDKRNQSSDGHSSSGIILQSDNEFAKSTIAFRDKDGNDVGWLQAHNYLDEALSNQHKHMSLETSDSTGQVQTRLDIPYGADTIEMKVTSANFTVGSGGNFTVTDGTSTFGNTVSVDPTSGNAQMMIDRPANTNLGALNFRTNGSDNWAIRESNDSTNNLYVRNTANGVNAFKLIPGTGNATRIIQRAPGTATTDSNLDANTFEVYLNEAGNALTFRVKYADGTTVKSGTVSLA